MKIKHRFRKALFAFFKDEIIKVTGIVSHIEMVSKELEFTHIRSEIILDDSRDMRYPTGVLYEQALEECKVELFQEAIKHVHINESSVMESQMFGGRRIEVSLFIGKESH